MVIYDSIDSDNLMNAMSANLKNAKELFSRLTKGSAHLVEVIDSGVLSSAANTAGRDLFKAYIDPMIQNLSKAINDIESDLTTYRTAEGIARQHDSHLDEALLKKQLNTTKKLIRLLQKKIDDDKDLMKNLELAKNGDFSTIGDNLGKLPALNAQLDNLEDSKKIYEQQIEALKAFERSTSPLFTDSLQSFKYALQGVEVINQSKASVDGSISFPAGTNMSWLANLKNQSLDSKDGNEKSLEDAVSNLGLNDDTLAYWKKEMKSELKDVPIDQWDKKIKEAKENLLFDDEGNILQISEFSQGVIVIKNGVYDKKLTEQANKEINSENWEAVKNNLAQFLVGGAEIVGGGLLDLTGAALITGGAGFTLTGGGAAVGVPAVSAGTTLEAVGTGAVVTGGITAGNALTKMNVPASGVQYSFTSNSQDREKTVGEKSSYSPHYKHIGNGSWNNASKMDLSDEEAQKVLDDAIQSGNQKYGYKDGKIYEFQNDNAGINPQWHGYEISGDEMRDKGAINILRKWKAEGKISNAEYGKLKKGK